MKREELKALELSDEVIEKVMTMHGKGLEAQKTAAQTILTENETLKGQLNEANNQINNFKGMKTQEEVDAAVGEWKNKFEQAQTEAQNQVAAIKFDFALKEALKEHKVKDPADVIPHLKRDALKLSDDGKFIGLTEQIEPLKTAKEYLFESAAPPPPKIVKGGNSQSVVGDATVNAAMKAAGLPTQ